jgi:proteic killer suppression protein
MKLQHKGLKLLFERDDARLVPASLAPRLRRILSDLHYAQQPRDVDIPSYRLHPLKGDRKGQWSVRVSGNWRITFRFVNGEATDVDLIDYH